MVNGEHNPIEQTLETENLSMSARLYERVSNLMGSIDAMGTPLSKPPGRRVAAGLSIATIAFAANIDEAVYPDSASAVGSDKVAPQLEPFKSWSPEVMAKRREITRKCGQRLIMNVSRNGRRDRNKYAKLIMRESDENGQPRFKYQWSHSRKVEVCALIVPLYSSDPAIRSTMIFPSPTKQGKKPARDGLIKGYYQDPPNDPAMSSSLILYLRHKNRKK